ncbi:MAG: hypothetical protein NTV81_04825, partial [Candidatus Komeilibacteria bacterium]|nr:hypothetical protein [Candidatus Komeilibacteria bacterium]
MLDSFLLSFFALVFFILAIYSFDKISFEFLSTGKQIRISSSRLILISSLVIVITVLATVFFLN